MIVAKLLKGLKLGVTKINHIIFAEIYTVKLLGQAQTEAHGLLDCPQFDYFWKTWSRAH